MREAFEKWAVEQAGQHNYYYTNLLLTKDENANYCTTWVDSAWLGWQAAWEYRNDNH